MMKLKAFLGVFFSLLLVAPLLANELIRRRS